MNSATTSPLCDAHGGLRAAMNDDLPYHDADRRRPGGDGIGEVVDLGVCVVLALEDDEGLVGELARGFLVVICHGRSSDCDDGL